MSNALLTNLPLTLLVVTPLRVNAQLIPTPEFSAHEIPTQSVPPAAGVFWEYLDVTALLVALCLATYFAFVTRSRRHLLALTVASLLWFGFWRKGCVCAIGATQNVALTLFDPSYVVPASVVLFFCLPLAFTLFFGRTFCAAVCPLGAVQELVAIRPVAVPRWLDESLGLLAYVYLGFAVILAASGTAFVICQYDPYVAFFRLSGEFHMLVFGACLLLIGVFVGRPYCRYLCPYGALLRVLSRLTKWHVPITPSDCIECHLCADACPYGAIRPPTVPQSAAKRAAGKRRALWMLAGTPLILAGLACVGTLLADALASWDPNVRLASQLWQEDRGKATQPTDASEAFRLGGGDPEVLYAAAIETRDKARVCGGLLGAWVGLVISGKLVWLSLRRQRRQYAPERAHCVSCARCFKSCPVEMVRLGLIEDVSEVVEAH